MRRKKIPNKLLRFFDLKNKIGDYLKKQGSDLLISQNQDLINDIEEYIKTGDQLAETNSNLLKEIEKINANHASEIEGINANHASEIEGINANHASEIEGINANHASEIEGINTKHNEAIKIKDNEAINIVKTSEDKIAKIKNKIIPDRIRNNDFLLSAYKELIDDLNIEAKIPNLVSQLINLYEVDLWDKNLPRNNNLPKKIQNLSISLYEWYEHGKNRLPQDYLKNWTENLNYILNDQVFGLLQVHQGESFQLDIHDSGGEQGLTVGKVMSHAIIFDDNRPPFKAMIEVK